MFPVSFVVHIKTHISVYYSSGFISLQFAIDMSIVGVKLNQMPNETLKNQPAVGLQTLAAPAYINTDFMGTIFQLVFPILIVIAFSVTAAYIARTVCQEKENRLTVGHS